MPDTEQRPVGLDLLRSFQAIYRTGTVTDAARGLGLSQPTVTAHLRALEEAAGRPLFVRGPRGCTATPAGEDLARRLEEPLAQLSGIAAALGQQPDPANSTLRLAGPAEFTEVRLAPALAELTGSGMTVHIELGLAQDLLTELGRDHHDLVVSTVRPPSGLVSTPLTDEEFVLVASPELAAGIDLAAAAAEPAAVLGRLPMVAYAQHQPIIRRWWRHVLGVRPPVHPRVVVPDLRTVRAFTVAGAGVTVLPTYLCADELRDGRLVQLLRPEDAPINTLYLATTTRRRHQPHVALAWETLLRRAGHTADVRGRTPATRTGEPLVS